MDNELTGVYFVNVFRKIWSGKKLVVQFTLASFLIGIIIILFSPKIYFSDTTFVPQTSESNNSASKELGSLASLAGINLNAEALSSVDNYLSPLLYNKIIDSEEFSVSLFNQELVKSDGTKILLRDHLLDESKKFSLSKFISKYTIGLFKNSKDEQEKMNEIFNGYNFISNEDYYLINLLKSKFEVEINKIEGYIKVFAFDKSPIISSQLVLIITKTLQSRIIELRTNKIREQLVFSESQYKNQKILFEKLQNKLAEFKDSNKSISTAVFRSQLQRLESDYQLQQSILIRLSSEYHNNKIKLNRDTPIFSVLDEVSVPNSNSRPFSSLILVISTILGLVISISYILFKDTFLELSKKILN